MKKSLVVIATLVTAIAVHADVLYWMVSDAEAASSSASSSENFAVLKATYNGTTVDLDTRTSAQVFNAYDTYPNSDQFAYKLASPPLSDPYSNWSFFVELVADGRKTESVSYQSLVDSGYLIRGNSMSAPSTMLAGFGQSAGTSYAVPEPTSGLLFLVGGVLLGLKRRRQA